MSLLPELARPLADNRQFFQGVLMMVMVAFVPRCVFDGFCAVHAPSGGRTRSPIKEIWPCRRWFSMGFQTLRRPAGYVSDVNMEVPYPGASLA